LNERSKCIILTLFGFVSKAGFFCLDSCNLNKLMPPLQRRLVEFNAIPLQFDGELHFRILFDINRDINGDAQMHILVILSEL
jgi:hypothetical protein